MPTRPPKPCIDCGALSPNARCDEHARNYARQVHDPKRAAVYNTRQWSAARRRVLARDPWCQVPDCPNMATDVDHVRPLRESVDDPFDEGNLQGLCKRHHSQKTQREVFGRKS